MTRVEKPRSTSFDWLPSDVLDWAQLYSELRDGSARPGAPGQVLMSMGPGQPPRWMNPAQTGAAGATAALLSVGPVAPTMPPEGMVWVDTSKNPPLLRLWDGSAGRWVDTGTAGAVNAPGGVQGTPVPPSSPSRGQLWVDTSPSPPSPPLIRLWNGGSWITLALPDGVTIHDTPQHTLEVLVVDAGTF